MNNLVDETLYECFLAAKDLRINPQKEFFPQFLDFAETAVLEDPKVVDILGIIQDLAFEIYQQKTPTIRNSHRETVVGIINLIKEEHDNSY